MTIGHFQSTISLTKGYPVGIAALSNQISDHYEDAGTVHAGIAFHPDGHVDDLGPGILDRTKFVAGEWYPNEPISNIGAFYDVRWESNFSGTDWDFQAESITVWIPMTDERIWRNTVATMAAPTISTTSAYFEVRTTGIGTYIDRAIYTGEASN